MSDAPDYADSLEAQMIADYVSDGKTLVDACRWLGASYGMAFKRIRESERFAQMMEDARTAGAEVIASDTRLVARGVEGHSSGDAKRDKLIVETDLKLLAKWHPHKYGEKLQIEQKSATVAIPVTDDPVLAQKAYEDLMRGG